eukprot:1042425-Amorphochlora_amoeboformis.AAC.1
MHKHHNLRLPLFTPILARNVRVHRSGLRRFRMDTCPRFGFRECGLGSDVVEIGVGGEGGDIVVGMAAAFRVYLCMR